MDYTHVCEFDRLRVVDDTLYVMIKKKEEVVQGINYCPICGWSRTLSELAKLQDTRDGI